MLAEQEFAIISYSGEACISASSLGSVATALASQNPNQTSPAMLISVRDGMLELELPTVRSHSRQSEPVVPPAGTKALILRFQIASPAWSTQQPPPQWRRMMIGSSSMAEPMETWHTSSSNRSRSVYNATKKIKKSHSPIGGVHVE
jgi:hypothetical protein